MDNHNDKDNRSNKKAKNVTYYFRASVRTIPLDKKTLEYLSEWKEIQALEVKTDFVLSYNDVPNTRGSLFKVINIYSKAANVHRIRVHALQNFHASLLISIGEKSLIIKERLRQTFKQL